MDGLAASWSADQVRDWLGQADAVITSWHSPRLTAEVLSASPRLRFIGHAAGTVAPYVDLSAWDRGITVVSANSAMAAQVAEWAVTLALISLRRWHHIRENLYRRRTWGEQKWDADSESLCDQTVGLVGFGEVARRALRMFAAFNCTLRVSAPEPPEEIVAGGGRKADLTGLLAQARVVSLHAPLNEETRGMIGRAELAAMQDGAVLVNTARGQLVDQEALMAECRSGRLRAALDVTDPEPLPPDSPLWGMDNVIISPHNAGPVPRRQREFGRGVVDDLESFLAGRPLVGGISRRRAGVMTRKMR